MNYSSVYYKDISAKYNVATALKKLGFNANKDVIMCVGTDSIVGDCLAPMVGTLLKKSMPKVYIYGALDCPIIAQNVISYYNRIKKLHKNSKILVIDAAVGDKEDVGVIRVLDGAIRPGLGVKKDLGLIGDLSLIGVVAKRSNAFSDYLYSAKVGFVYQMANVITESILAC